MVSFLSKKLLKPMDSTYCNKIFREGGFGMKFYNKRPLLLVFCIILLVLISLTLIYQPIYKISPNPFLGSLPFQQEAIITQPYQPKFKLLEPVRIFLLNKLYVGNSILRVYFKRYYITHNIDVSLIVLCMFYIFYRLSRTDTDDLIFNMENVN